jgi:2-C-methyl-D-erythritol 4-phosphate cytidylyltransferase/2-C-methyl-D-erythritol 2,4-cyclodiphosphate synthase
MDSSSAAQTAAQSAAQSAGGGTLALVVAAGRGERFGGAKPKQYADLAGQPLLRHSLAALTRHPAIDRVRAVINPDDQTFYEAAGAGLDLLPAVAGGDSRQASVRLGLESLEELNPGQVLIHDGARPFVAHDLIDRILAALGDAPGAIAALPLADTVKREADGNIAGTVARDGLWRAQTPQGFRFAEILGAHRAASGELGLTDDAAVAEQAGLTVRLVDGDPANLKITTPADLDRAARWLAGAEDIRGEEIRSGSTRCASAASTSRTTSPWPVIRMPMWDCTPWWTRFWGRSPPAISANTSRRPTRAGAARTPPSSPPMPAIWRRRGAGASSMSTLPSSVSGRRSAPTAWP